MTFITLLLYAVGCGVSQSLMSLGGGLCAAIVVWEAARTRLRTLTPRERAAVALGFAYTVTASINLLCRPFDDRTGQTLGRLPLVLVPLLPLFVRVSASQFRWIVRAALAGLAISVARAGWEFFHDHRAATSFMKNPIYLAYNLLPATLFFGELGGRAGLGGLAMSLFGLVTTVSRTALSCALAYLAMRWAPRALKAGARGAGLVLLLLVAGGITAYRWSPLFQAKIDQTLSSEDPSRHWRQVAWSYNAHLFAENPVWGVGPERNGIDVAKQPEFAGHWQPGHLYFAHSAYLQVAAESGLVGLITFFGLWIALAWAAPAVRPFMIVMGAAAITENLFNNSRAAHAFFFYALMTLLAARPREAPRGSA